MSVVTFAGKVCVDPRDLRRECEDRGVPVAPWWGKANGFFCGLEAAPGFGWVLMRTADVPSDLTHYYPLKFDDGSNPAVELGRIFAVRSWVVVQSNESNPGGVTLLELRDAREKYTSAVSDGTAQMPDDGDRVGYSVRTWATLVSTVVGSYGRSAAAVASATLPFTPNGNPEGFDYRGWTQRSAIDHLLRRLACAFKLNPITHALSIVRLGDTDTAADSAVASMTAAAVLLWNTAADTSNKLFPTIRIQFDKSPAETDRTEPRTSDGNPAYSGPDSSGSSDGFNGGVFALADDLYAQRPVSGSTYLNATALDDRANERIADYVRVKQGFELHKRKVWEGWHQGAATALGAQWGRASWFDFGDGPRTELLCEPGERLERWRPARMHPLMFPTSWYGDNQGFSSVSSTLKRLTSQVLLPTARVEYFEVTGTFRAFIDGTSLTGDETVTFGFYVTNSGGTALTTALYTYIVDVPAYTKFYIDVPFSLIVKAGGGNTDTYYAAFATLSSSSITLSGGGYTYFFATPARYRTGLYATAAANTNTRTGGAATQFMVRPPAPTLTGAILYWNGSAWVKFDPPTVDDAYKLKAVVSGGVASLVWVSDP